MKIFISWSGTVSKNLAEILRQWLPAVVQAVKPYYSPDDITKGARWTTEIAKELEEASIGIICLTKDNLEAPWVMFEAGALSKKMDKSKVCPILFDVDASEIQGPLVQFQAAKFDKDDIKRVARMMNLELGDRGLAPNVFDEVFEMWWPKLKEKVEAELKKPHKKEKGNARSERELLEEILELTRATSIVSSQRFEGERWIHPAAVEDLLSALRHLLRGIRRMPPNMTIQRAVEELRRPIGYIIHQADIPRSMVREFELVFEDATKRPRSQRLLIDDIVESEDQEDSDEKPSGS